MKKSVTDVLGKLPIDKNINPVSSAKESFDLLVNAWSDYKQTHERETTKRAGIDAWKVTRLQEIETQRTTLELYLKEVFKERATTIGGFFDRLDQGIASGNAELINGAINAIVDVTKQSPLAGAQEVLAALRDPEVKSIEI